FRFKVLLVPILYEDSMMSNEGTKPAHNHPTISTNSMDKRTEKWNIKSSKQHIREIKSKIDYFS
ncbi:MAG: hypothetical protein WB474_13485, partial [Nitrososphaeraceae archaeon]